MNIYFRTLLIIKTQNLCFSKKWKKLLTFPHISECIHLQTTLKSDNYDYIVDQQPIGSALFRQFCVVSKKPYHHYNDFLDDIENYETELEENRVAEAQKIYHKYLSKPQGEISFIANREEKNPGRYRSYETRNI